MSVFKTSQGRDVEHCHIPDPPCRARDWTPEEIEERRRRMRKQHPLAVEASPPSTRYNCHGFALAGAHGWFNKTSTFFADDYSSASFDSPQVGDVVVYYKGTTLMHTAVVTCVENNQIARLRSKWGVTAEVFHDLHDVRPSYGKPERLLRPLPGVREFETLMSDTDMTDAESMQEIIRKAVESISDPDVYSEVEYASTPDAARKIIESLPGVQTLLAVGPEAGVAALHLLEKREGDEGDDELSSVALYILQRVPTREAVPRLAGAIREHKFSGLNLYLAADALLSSAEIEVVSEDPLAAALRAAENLK